MNLLPTFPGPLRASRFRSTTEGWNVVGYPTAGVPRLPSWVAITDPAGTDFSGYCRYASPAGETGWYFHAPAEFAAAGVDLYGGVLVFGLSVVPPATASATPAVTSPDVVLVAPTLKLGLPSAASAAAAIAGPLPQQKIVTIRLREGEGWLNVATGTPATADEWRTALAGLTDLLIRGDTVPGAREASLSAVELYQDPAGSLLLDVTARYEDGALSATWPPSSFAAAYQIEVKDDLGATVLAQTVEAATFSPPIALQAVNFQPVENRTYTVKVRVLGRQNAGAAVRIIPLAKPAPVSAIVAGGVKLSWPAVPNALTYQLAIKLTGGAAVAIRAAPFAATEATVTIADGLAVSTAYEARVRAIAGASFGPWSDPVAIRIASAAEILAALSARLGAPGAGGSVTLDATTLPAGLAGEPDRVLRALLDVLGSNATSLAIALTGNPVLSATALTLAGKATLLGCSDASLAITFTVSPPLRLELTLALTPPENWVLSDSFADLGGTLWDGLALGLPRLRFTTFVHEEPGVFYPLTTGLNLDGALLISPQLALLAYNAAPAGNQSIAVGGSITRGTSGTTLALSAQAGVNPLTVTLAGFAPLTITGGVLRLDGSPGATAGTRVDRQQIVGSVALGGQARPCTVDLPNRFRNRYILDVTFAAGQSATIADLAALVAGTGITLSMIPAGVGLLAVASVSQLRYDFMLGGQAPANATLKLATTGDWRFAGVLPVRGVGLDLTISKVGGPTAWTTLYAARLWGTVTVGNSTVTAEVFIPTSGDWTVALTGTPPPTLPDLLALAGLDVAATFAAFPAPLRPLATVGISQITVVGDPAGANLKQLGFTLAQTAPWSVGSILTLRDGTLAINVDVAPFRAQAQLTATVRFGSTSNPIDFLAKLSLPPAAGQPWEIALAEGRTVAIPGIGDLLGLFGGSSPQLPTGLSGLSGLVVDRFLLRFQITPTPAVQQIVVSIAQTGQWVVIGPDKLVVTGFKGYFGIDPDGAGRAVTIDVGALVTVCGTSVAARFYRQAARGDWMLAIACSDAVPISGLAQLDGWLNPTAASSYVGDSAPLAGGAVFGNMYLTFDAASGALKTASFGLQINNPWTVIAGKLSIDQLYCRLQTTMPVSASTWTGQIGGRVTLAGASFRLTATKATQTSPWRFEGALVSPVTIELTSAANTLSSDGTFKLPADIRQFGQFPEAITIDTAEMLAVPDTGQFRFAGSATFREWNVGLGSATLQIRALGGEINVPKRGDPIRVRVTGSLSFAGLNANLFLQLGSSATVDTVLAGVISTQELPPDSLGRVADQVAGAGKWTDALSVLPGGFVPPGLTAAAFYINFSQGTLVLFGQASPTRKAALLVQRLPAAAASTPPTYGFSVSINIDGNFRFADVLPASAPAPLKTAFAAIDNVITVDQASLSVSSFTWEGTTNPYVALTALTDVAGTLPSAVPAPQAPPTNRIKRGLNLDATLRLTGSVWESLKFIVETRADRPIYVHATFDPVAPDNTLFEASLGGFTILQTLQFDQVDLAYRPKGDTTLTLTCSGSVNVPAFIAPAQGAQPTEGNVIFRFTGSLTVRQTDAVAVLDAPTEFSLLRPLGITTGSGTGITLNRVGLRLAYAFDRDATTGVTSNRRLTRFALDGKVTLGSGAGAIEVSGSIIFVSGTPQVLLLTLDKPLGIGAFFAQCIGTNAYDSPLFPDLTFRAGSIYYARQAVPAVSGQPAYAQGFHLQVGIDVFGLDFVLRADVTENDGISGSAAPANAIDLGFVSLTGPQGTGGPAVALVAKTGNKKYELQFGLVLFGLTFTNGSFAYNKPASGEPFFSGSITYPGAIPGLGSNFTLSGTWSKSAGFKVTSWPLTPEITQAIDWIKLFAEVGSGDPCQALGALGITKDMVQSSFTVDVQMANSPPPATTSSSSSGSSSSSPPPRPSIDLQVTIGYTIKIKLPGAEAKEIISTHLNPFPMSFEVPRSIADFVPKIVEGVVNSVPLMVRGILDDPAALAKLTAALVLANVSKEAISSLICRGVRDANLEQEARNRAENESKPESDLDKANRNADSAAGAADAGAAAGFAASAEVFAAAAISIFATIIGWFSSLFGSKSSEQREAEAKQAEAERARDRAINAVKAKLVVSGVSSSYVRRGRVSASWNAVSGQNISYIVAITCDGSTAPAQTLTGTSCTIDDAAFGPGKRISVAVQARVPKPAVGNAPSFGPEYYTGDPTAQIINVPDFGPAALVLEQVGQTLVTRWNAGPQAADSFSIQIKDASGTLLPIPAIASAGGLFQAIVPEAQLRVGTAYTASVTPQKANNPTDATTTLAVTLVALTAPQHTQIEYLSGAQQIDVRWSGPQNATDFVVQTYQNISSPLGLQIAAAGASRLSLAKPTFTPPTFSIRVGARTANAAQTVWAAPVSITLADLPKPTASALEYAGGVLEARWPAVPNAAGYEFRLSTDAGALATQPSAVVQLAPPAGQQPDPAHPYPLARFSGAVLPAGRLLKFQVRATNNANSYSAWSDFNANSSVTLPAIVPTACRTERVGTALVVRWQAGSGGRRPYDVRMQDSAGQPVATPTNIQIEINQDAFTARITGAGLTTGTAYTFAVHAQDAGLDSDWVAAAPITFVALAAPQSIAATHLSGSRQIAVTWSGPQPAASFLIQAYTNIFAPIEQRAATGASTLTLENAAFVAPTVFSVRVGSRTSGDAQTVWSDPISIVMADPAKPVISAIEYSATNGLEVRWPAIIEATGYETLLTTAAGAPLVVQPQVAILLAPPADQQPDPAHPYPLARFSGALPLGQSVKCQVRAIVAGGSYSAWSDLTAQSSFTLPGLQPIQCQVEQVKAGLSVRWQPGPAGRGTYEVRVQNGAGTALATQPDIQIDQTALTARLTGPALVAGTAYVVAVRGRNAAAISDWVPCPPITFLALAAPDQVKATYSVGSKQLVVSWSGPLGQPSFVVQVYTDIAAPVENRVISGAGTTPVWSLTLDNPTFVPPAVFLVRVGVRTANDAQTVWSEPIQAALVDLAKPMTSAFAYGANGFEARWPAVPGAEGYETLLSSGATPLQPQPAATLLLVPPAGEAPDPARPYPLARFPNAVLPSGQPLRFQVRTIAGQSYGPWSDVSPASTIDLSGTAPINCRAEQVAPTLVVRWWPGPDGERPYEACIQDEGRRVLAQFPPGNPNDPREPLGFFARTVPPPTDRRVYRLGVRAVIPGFVADWVLSPPIAFVALPPPDFDVSVAASRPPGLPDNFIPLDVICMAPPSAVGCSIDALGHDRIPFVPKPITTQIPPPGTIRIVTIIDPRFVIGSPFPFQIRVGLQVNSGPLGTQVVWSERRLLAFTSLGPPQNLRVTRQADGSAIAAWDRGPGEECYRISLQVGNAPPVLLQRAFTGTQVGIGLPNPPGTTIQVYVQAYRAGLYGPVAVGTLVVPPPPPPPSPPASPIIVSALFVCRERQVQATWKAQGQGMLDPRAVYEMQLTRNSAVVGQSPPMPGNCSQIGAMTPLGPGCQVRVRQRIDATVFDWAVSNPFSVLAVPPPASLRLLPLPLSLPAGMMRPGPPGFPPGIGFQTVWAAVTVPGATNPVRYATRILCDGRTLVTNEFTPDIPGYSAPNFILSAPGGLALPGRILTATVRAMVDGSVSDWAMSAPLPAPAGPLLPPDMFAQQLRLVGVSGPDAAALIATLPAPRPSPPQLITLLRRFFPETASAPVQLIWALSNIQYDRKFVTMTLEVPPPPFSPPDIAFALDVVFPPFPLVQLAQSIAQAGRPWPEAVFILKNNFPPLTATQAGFALLSRFPFTGAPEIPLAAALRARFPLPETADALHRLMPQVPPEQMTAAINQAYS